MAVAIDPKALRDALKGANLRATASRLAVLRALHSTSGPVSHGEIADQLADAGFDRATIYRNLIDLTNAGIARRFDGGDHTWRFELARSAQEHLGHAHFVCVDCGDVQCLPESAVAITAAVPVSSPRSLAERVIEIQLRGHCDECLE